MKHNKHIHDENYDINIKLMVPLLSMLVCTICLCATTWAWYTASVTSGVSAITAGVTPSVITITPLANTITTNEEVGISVLADTPPLSTDEYGYYILDNNTQYNVKLSNDGTSESGYHCMFTVTDGDGSLLGIFYTDRFWPDSNQEHEYWFMIKPRFDGESIKFKVDTMWGEPPENVKVISNESQVVILSDTKTESQLIVKDASNFALGQVEIDEDIPKYSYTIRFIDIDTYFEIRDSISGETAQEVLDIADYKIENYEFDSATYGELGEDDDLYLEIDTEAETNDFVISYKKVVVEPDEEPSSVEEQENSNGVGETSETPSEGNEQNGSEEPVSNNSTENANTSSEDTDISEPVTETPESTEPGSQTENTTLDEDNVETIVTDTSEDSNSVPTSDETAEQDASE